MGFRITTNMMKNTYQYNLMNSTNKVSDARDKVLTQRNFNSYAEDPAAATMAFRLRRDFCETTSQIANTKDVYSKFNTAWNNIQGMLHDLINPMDKVSIIRGEQDTAGESRTALAQVLRESAESIIQGFNQELGGHFIFAGNDGLNAPFTWKGETLYYRGIDVNSGGVKKPTAKESDWAKNWKTNLESVLSNFDTTDPAKVAQKDALEHAQSWSKYFLRETDTAPGPQADGRAYLQAISASDTRADKEDWIKYYNGETNVKPTTTEPDWVEKWDESIDAALSGLDVNDPAKVAEKEAYEKELAWCKFFLHETNEMPGDAAEGEAHLNAFMADADNNGMSPTERDGWVKYYMHYTEEPPTADLPDWATKQNADGTPAVDKYGVPTEMPTIGKDDMENAWIAYYTDQGNYAKLKEMSEEEMYIDLGMGAEEKGANNPLKGTYFNSALSGLNFLDYGVDEDGDPKNFAILLRELADVFDTWDEDTQSYNPDIAKNSAAGLTTEELQAKAYRLMDKLKAGQETLTAANVELDARSTYLQTNQKQLETQSTNLNTEILDVEQVDLAAAITDFSWDMYCYNAALKIGNQLLSQSLIDYMS